jgi:hypothetical protein
MVMLVGIGFVAILTVTIAHRFVGEPVGEQVAAAEVAIEREEAEVLAELRDLRRRLRDLEGVDPAARRSRLTRTQSSSSKRSPASHRRLSGGGGRR